MSHGLCHSLVITKTVRKLFQLIGSLVLISDCYIGCQVLTTKLSAKLYRLVLRGLAHLCLNIAKRNYGRSDTIQYYRCYKLKCLNPNIPESCILKAVLIKPFKPINAQQIVVTDPYIKWKVRGCREFFHRLNRSFQWVTSQEAAVLSSVRYFKANSFNWQRTYLVQSGNLWRLALPVKWKKMEYVLHWIDRNLFQHNNTRRKY
jgi:hypothetical protein